MHKPLPKDTAIILQSAVFGNVRSITDAISLQVGSWHFSDMNRCPLDVCLGGLEIDTKLKFSRRH
jgi:hypothetical protein